MGRIFLEHMDGEVLYHCIKCKTNLTSQENLVNSRFVGSCGPAVVFRAIINIMHAKPLKCRLQTGQYTIKNVFCKKCASKLGWFYEYAFDARQRYKEGLTALERNAIVKMNAKGKVYTTF